MNQSLKAVLFDLDGTLIDTAPDFIRIINTLCQSQNLSTPSDAAIREQVSAGARAMVKLMFDIKEIDDNDPKLLALRDEFLAVYQKDICVDSCLFEGLDDLLSYLEQAGIFWGIVTNKPRHLSELLLQSLNLNNHCAVLVCPDDVKNTKPDPEPLFLACQKLGIMPENAIYIGDHQRDIESGKRANIKTVIAEYGYLTKQDKLELSTWGADNIVKSPAELTDFIKSLI